jgi:CBS domain-containing protein
VGLFRHRTATEDGERRRAPAFEDACARDVMRRRLVTVPASAPLSEVERTLAESDVSGAPVVEPNGRIVGVISTSDLLERYTEDPDSRPRRNPRYMRMTSEEIIDEDFEDYEGPDLGEEVASDVMTAEVYTVDADASLREVARELVRHKVHRLLVKEDDRFVGIVGTLDLVRFLAS